MTEILEEQNKIIISLLARSVIGIQQIEKIVRSGKKKGDPDKFVLAYNALDGTTSGVDLAKIVGISQPGMVSVLQTWENEGIIYKVGKTGRYAGLLKIPLKKRVSNKKKLGNIKERDKVDHGEQETS
jgi:hypothetical protein